jgi:hypothetical protein
VTGFGGAAFLATGGATKGVCQDGCGSWITGRWVRTVPGGGSGAGGFEVVDGSQHGHTCDGPEGEPVRRCSDPKDWR